MGADVALTLESAGTGKLHIKRATELQPICWDLGEQPDLFPVLSVLCALAPGKSQLTGAPQLAYKESNRLEKCAELIKLIGRDCEMTNDGMNIDGRPFDPVGDVDRSTQTRLFDPAADHRMVMAAALAARVGFNLKIGQANLVRKSFPEFSQLVGAEP